MISYFSSSITDIFNNPDIESTIIVPITDIGFIQDDILAERMEQRIQALYAKLNDADNKLPTFDALIKDANEKRKTKMQMRHMGIVQTPTNYLGYNQLGGIRSGIPSYRAA